MIAFACAVKESDAYRAHAGPGIDLAAERDSERHIVAAVGSVCRSYNLLLDQAAGDDGLEALVIVQEDVQIADPRFCAAVRRALADPQVAVAGCIGATGVASVAWWDAAVTAGRVIHRYPEYGGGELDAFAWARTAAPPAEVDMVAGFLLVLSPWAVRSLRFDEELFLGTGFDLDFCLRARDAGKKVVTADLQVVHHHSLRLIEDPEAWIDAYMRVAQKWDAEIRTNGSRDADWEWRARRAEAEASAARLMGGLEELLRVAHWKQLEAMQNSLSWRITAPLRRLRHRLAKGRS